MESAELASVRPSGQAKAFNVVWPYGLMASGGLGGEKEGRHCRKCSSLGSVKKERKKEEGSPHRTGSELAKKRT